MNYYENGVEAKNLRVKVKGTDKKCLKQKDQLEQGERKFQLSLRLKQKLENDTLMEGKQKKGEEEGGFGYHNSDHDEAYFFDRPIMNQFIPVSNKQGRDEGIKTNLEKGTVSSNHLKEIVLKNN